MTGLETSSVHAGIQFDSCLYDKLSWGIVSSLIVLSCLGINRCVMGGGVFESFCDLWLLPFLNNLQIMLISMCLLMDDSPEPWP